jgi:23S rRNA (guanosine2251-2'-O)-methyltransferase
VIVHGVNPILEVLAARPDTVERVWLAEGTRVHGLDRLFDLARQAGVRIERVPRDRIARLAGGAVHQGVLAEVAEVGYVEPEDLVATAKGQGEEPLLVALDQIQDPIHLGAIVRSAHALGGHGVIVPKDRAASLTPAAVKASAGATAHLPVARATNLARALENLKAAGVWTVGADMDGEPADRVDLTGPLCLVIGNEGSGMRPLVRSTCDRIVAIPMARQSVGSLSASAAAAVLLYEVARQRRARERARSEGALPGPKTRTT